MGLIATALQGGDEAAAGGKLVRGGLGEGKPIVPGAGDLVDVVEVVGCGGSGALWRGFSDIAGDSGGFADAVKFGGIARVEGFCGFGEESSG